MRAARGHGDTFTRANDGGHGGGESTDMFWADAIEFILFNWGRVLHF